MVDHSPAPPPGGADPEAGQALAAPTASPAGVRRGVALVLGLLGVAYAAMTMLADTGGLREAFTRLGWQCLVLPLACTLASYLTMVVSYQGILRVAGATVGWRDLLRITLVANTANYILPSGGLTGFAIRLVFFTRRGISPGSSVAISFTQTLITNMMLVLFVFYGLVSLLLNGRIGGAILTASAVATVLLVAGFAVLLAMIYSTSVRRAVLAWTAHLVDRVLDRLGRHATLGERARRFFVYIDEGMALFAGRPGEMLGPAFWIFLDWLFMMGTLWSAFLATGVPVDFGSIAIAFSVSSVASFVTFVPAGAGVIEWGLGGTLAGLGIPLEQSLLPIFLYRFSYFVVPTVLALVLAPGAFTGDPAAAEKP